MQPLLLLHGAIGSPAQLEPLADKLRNNYKVYTYGFPGHGGKPVSCDPFSIELFANDVLSYITAMQLDAVQIFGYSMGGYVSMYLARHYPEKITKVITLATKYHWDPAIAAKEIQMLNPEKIEQKIPAFAATLKERHTPALWKEVLTKTTEMMGALGNNNVLKPEDYAQILTPALILLGDRDKMVTLEETVSVYKALPNALLGILPGTQHPIEHVNMDMLAYMANDFLR